MSSKNSFSKHIFSCPHILSKPSDQHQRVVIEPCHFRLYVTWFNLSPSVPTRWLRVGHPVESTCCHSCKYNVHWVQVRARHICILLWSEQSWPLVNISPTNPRDLKLQLQCSYSSQRRGELDDNSDSQLVGWRPCIYRMHFWGTPAMHGSRIFPVNTFLQWSTHSMRWDVSWYAMLDDSLNQC